MKEYGNTYTFDEYKAILDTLGGELAAIDNSNYQDYLNQLKEFFLTIFTAKIEGLAANF